MKISKILIFILLAIATVSCGQVTKKQDTTTTEPCDTLHPCINAIYYNLIMQGDLPLCMTNAFNGDTVLPMADYYHSVHIEDIDHDCLDDLRVYVFSNSPTQCDTYLFDFESQTFKQIDCSDEFFKIGNTDYFFTSHQSGCAGMNWESELCKIIDYKMYFYGKMYLLSCDDIKPVIQVYKLTNINENPETLMEELPYGKFSKSGKTMNDFLENYWKKNYRKYMQ